jgi:hypothetical protein
MPPNKRSSPFSETPNLWLGTDVIVSEAASDQREPEWAKATADSTMIAQAKQATALIQTHVRRQHIRRACY